MKNPIVKAKNRIRNSKGETLTETLGSLLIIVPAMVMLAGAIVSAAKINNEVKQSAALKPPTFSSGVPLNTDAATVSYGGKNITFTFSWSKDDAKSYYGYFR